MWNKMSDRFKTNILRILFVSTLLLIWEALAHWGWADPFYVSRPSAILIDFKNLFASGEIWPHISITMQAMLIGLFLGCAGGVIMAFVMARFTMVEKIMDPLIVAIYGIPKLALGPLFILWFGLGINSKIFLAFIWVFFIMYFNAYGGFKNVESRLVNAAKLMGASRAQIILKIVLPSSLPWLFTGLRAGLGVALLGAIVGEYIGAMAGLGHLVQYAGNMFNTTRVFSTILVMTILMMLMNEGVKYAEHRILRWRPSEG
ncbi:MAG: ABC transporter permease [Smithellaceae bacterium]